MMRPPPIRPDRNVGVGLLILSGYLTYSEIITPLVSATHHEQTAIIISNAVYITPVSLALGIIMTIMGEKTHELIGHPDRYTILGGIVLLGSFIVGCYLKCWLENRVSDYGYF